MTASTRADRNAFFCQRVCLAQIIEDHTIPDEPEGVAREHCFLAQRLAELKCSCDRLRRRLASAHDLEQRHDVRGDEEVQAEHALRTLGRIGKLVDVERRGIRRENRVRLRDAVEFAKHVALDVEIFEDRLDDEIDVGEARSSRR